MWSARILLATAITLPACSQQADESGKPASPPKAAETPTVAATGPLVTVIPSDLSSATANTPVTLWVDDGDRLIRRETLDAISATVQLEQFPSGKPVPFDVQVVSPAAPEQATEFEKGKAGTRPPVVQTSNPARSGLVIVPKTTLGEGWYRVSFKPESAGVRTMATMNPRFGDARVGSRFSPESSPVVQSITRCGDGAAQKVVVRVSEPMEWDADLPSVWVGAEKCTQKNPAGPTAMLVSSCASSDENAPVRLMVPPAKNGGSTFGLMSASGAIGSTPLELAVQKGDGQPSEPGCRIWIP